MEETKPELGIIGQAVFVEFDYFGMPDAQPGGVKLKIGLFFGSHPDAYIAYAIHMLFVIVNLTGVVNHRYNVYESIIDEAAYFTQVSLWFEAIADDERFFGNLTFGIQSSEQINVKSRGCFEVNIVAEHLVEDIAEMTAFGTIAVVILPTISHRFHGSGEKISCLVYL
jgi:hypothetical protein